MRVIAVELACVAAVEPPHARTIVAVVPDIADTQICSLSISHTSPGWNKAAVVITAVVVVESEAKPEATLSVRSVKVSSNPVLLLSNQNNFVLAGSHFCCLYGSRRSLDYIFRINLGYAHSL